VRAGWLIGAVVAASALLSTSPVPAGTYEGQAFHLIAVEGETGRPLADVHAVAEWIHEKRPGLLGPLLAQAAVSGADGRLSFPGWGPMPGGPRLSPGWDPRITLFKPGYVPVKILNDFPGVYRVHETRSGGLSSISTEWLDAAAREVVDQASVRRFHQSGQTVAMAPFRGTPEQWVNALGEMQTPGDGSQAAMAFRDVYLGRQRRLLAERDRVPAKVTRVYSAPPATFWDIEQRIRKLEAGLPFEVDVSSPPAGRPLLCTLFSHCPYEGPGFRITIADAETGAPLAGVHAITEWVSCGYHYHTICSVAVIQEAISGPDGLLRFNSWKIAGEPWGIEPGRDPVITVFKPGYVLAVPAGWRREIANLPRFRAEATERVHRFAQDGTTYWMEPFTGTLEAWVRTAIESSRPTITPHPSEPHYRDIYIHRAELVRAELRRILAEQGLTLPPTIRSVDDSIVNQVWRFEADLHRMYGP
jgi:hypothetical protein